MDNCPSKHTDQGIEQLQNVAKTRIIEYSQRLNWRADLEDATCRRIVSLDSRHCLAKDAIQRDARERGDRLLRHGGGVRGRAVHAAALYPAVAARPPDTCASAWRLPSGVLRCTSMRCGLTSCLLLRCCWLLAAAYPCCSQILARFLLICIFCAMCPFVLALFYDHVRGSSWSAAFAAVCFLRCCQ